MKEKILALLHDRKKMREIALYLLFGALTTLVSWLACWLCKLFLDAADPLENNIINTVGWVAGVLFAYPVNRRFVFRSENPHVLKEFAGFAASRVSTWLIELAIMTLSVNVLRIDYWVAKIGIATVTVVILNYVFSKLFIFRKKTQ